MLFSHVLIEGRLPHSCPSTLVTFVLKSLVHSSFVGLQVGKPVALVRAICAVEKPLEGMDALHVVDNNPLGGSRFEVAIVAVKVSSLEDSGARGSPMIVINSCLASHTINVVHFYFLATVFSCDVMFHRILIVGSVITP